MRLRSGTENRFSFCHGLPGRSRLGLGQAGRRGDQDWVGAMLGGKAIDPVRGELGYAWVLGWFIVMGMGLDS
jgi:hypothetical protein